MNSNGMYRVCLRQESRAQRMERLRREAREKTLNECLSGLMCGLVFGGLIVFAIFCG